MRRLAVDGVKNPLTIRLAAAIVEGASGDKPMQVSAIASWLSVSTQFLADPRGIELLRTVPEMLADIERRGRLQADCDDIAILGAALGKAVGLASRFVVIGFRHPRAPYEHVYTEIHDGRRWRSLDIVRPTRPPAISRRATMIV